MDKYLNYI